MSKLFEKLSKHEERQKRFITISELESIVMRWAQILIKYYGDSPEIGSSPQYWHRDEQLWAKNRRRPGLSRTCALAPGIPDGAYVVYGHTVLQRTMGIGYMSDWAQEMLATRGERNAFYSQAGRLVPPGKPGSDLLNRVEATTPDLLLSELVTLA